MMDCQVWTTAVKKPNWDTVYGLPFLKKDQKKFLGRTSIDG